ncbi:hypothetical protein BM525_20705 (plasmid) [Alteromonas mediterranea]|uniref:DUF1566 domain-containing protein n=1 Tax=Alteromonas mediterranea TaxID=314275 RepID=A0AAC9JGR2_9ALTE|nr:DUF1566 domain-containing protein [Alteromonas mediterranea]APD92285.1 hypothetical protein BM524_20480 [Alteromonas mediterranea]APE00146.1 hypothetical protein BM525_20705 [Alteromonas mediterranea]
MKLTAAILSVAMLSFSAHVSAEIFTSQSGDEFRTVDVANEGDELAVLHYNTGLEWLNVRETWGMSMEGVTNALQGDLQGWRLPTSEEVDTLISSFFFGWNYSSTTYTTIRDHWSYHPVDEFGRMFGNGGTSKTYTTGKYYDENGVIRIAGGYVNGSKYSLIFGPNASYSYADTDTRYGVFLVSDGGVTMDSINDPSLNINNANAPVNSVSAPMAAVTGLFTVGLFGRIRRK